MINLKNVILGFVAAFFILSLALSPAQGLAKQQGKCPSVKVNAPGYVVPEGQAILFSTQIIGGNANQDFTFNWAVSAGSITSGQGTSVIRVDTKTLGGQSVTATVEIGGLHPECSSVASMTVDVEAKPAASAQAKSLPAKTLINDARAKAMLLGAHRFSLQWISWDYFGKAIVTDQKGKLIIRGEQRAKEGSDVVRLDGVITQVDAKEFLFNGTIEVKVSHNNNGKVCKREGEMTFKITQNRKYWRLQEMQSPCGDETDYVDIFFR
ncbi:MAG: hypothetical protein HY231_01840 [Acidobacteria bacterium]|nr:hypothetical protein [Acidobacteriota bacterium]